MQVLWAKLLANELVNPRRFSLRTLAVVRNLSTDEARLFRQVCAFSFGEGFLMDEFQLLEKTAGCTVSQLVLLTEAGLVVSPPLTATLKLEPVGDIADQKSRATVAYFDKLVDFETHRVLFRYGGDGWQVRGYKFTDAGMQLRTLVPQEAHPDMLRALEDLNDQRWTVRIRPNPDA